MEQPTSAATQPPAPWWRFGLVWMVIAGPAIVVAAGIATVVLAVRTPDLVIEPAPRQAALQPAVQGRNHAASQGRTSP